MSIDVKKWNPWNWFRTEEEREGHAVASGRKSDGIRGIPSFHTSHPLLGLHREMDRFFDGISQRLNAMLPDFSGSTLLKPNLDIKESGKAYQVTVEVPGVDEKDIKLELCDGVLTLSGEKKYEKEASDENWHCVERSYGSFKRMLSLPGDVNLDEIEASFKNGVLTITVPRKKIEKTNEERKVIDIKRAA